MRIENAMVMNRSGEILITGQNWEIPNVYTLSSSGSGDFTTVAEALAALSAGDVLLVDKGGYECPAETIPEDVTIIGLGPANTYFYADDNQSTLFISSGSWIQDIGIRNGYTFSAGSCVSFSGSVTVTPTLQNVILTHTGHTDGRALNAQYDINVQSSYLSSTLGAGIKMDTGATLYMFGGHIQANDEAIDNTGSVGTVNLYGTPRLIGTMVGDWNGSYIDSNGFMVGGTDFTMEFEERASAPATPATGRWRVYTKSDGVYVVDDAGTETGPFGSGGSGDPFFTYTRW